jgi:hypothetical protein
MQPAEITQENTKPACSGAAHLIPLASTDYGDLAGVVGWWDLAGLAEVGVGVAVVQHHLLEVVGGLG